MNILKTTGQISLKYQINTLTSICLVIVDYCNCMHVKQRAKSGYTFIPWNKNTWLSQSSCHGEFSICWRAGLISVMPVNKPTAANQKRRKRQQVKPGIASMPWKPFRGRHGATWPFCAKGWHKCRFCGRNYYFLFPPVTKTWWQDLTLAEICLRMRIFRPLSINRLIIPA